jgi:hypothetical protein
MVLHEGDTKAFAGVQPYQPTYYEDHESAEWQADTFARYVLVPRATATLLREKDAVANLCYVPEQTSVEAVSEVLAGERRKEIALSGAEVCPRCGQFSLSPITGCANAGCTGQRRRSQAE